MKKAIKNSFSMLHGLRAVVFLSFIAAAVAAGSAGCKGKGGSSGGGGPAPGAGIGPAGGTVNGPNGAQVIVPAGALAITVDIQIASSAAGAPAAPAGVTLAGAIFAATPHGTTFAIPATVRIPFDPAQVPPGATPKLFQAAPGGAFAEVPGAMVSGNFLVADVASFSYFGPGFAPPLQADSLTFPLGADRTPTGIAADPSGGVIVVGFASGEVFVTKLVMSGAVEWSHTTQGEITSMQSLPRVAVGPTGNVFVAAATTKDESGASLGGRTEVRVTSFNLSGAVRGGWPQRISANADNWPNAIAADYEDRLYVYGTSASSNFQAHDSFRPFLRIFTMGGAPFPAPALNFEGAQPSRRILAESIGIDPSGNKYLTARVIGFDGNLIDNGTGVQILGFNLLNSPIAGFPKRLSEDVPNHGAPLAGICRGAPPPG